MFAVLIGLTAGAFFAFFTGYFLALYKERDMEPFTPEELAN